MNDRSMVLAALLLGLALAGFHQLSKEAPDPKDLGHVSRKIRRQVQWQGKYAPDFELKLMDGTSFHLADVVGTKMIVLNFFATWCRPCREELPEFNRYWLAHRNDPFILLGIDVGEEEEHVRDFLKEFTISYPLGVDHARTIAKKYGVEAFPTTVLIGHQGKVVSYETGSIANADVVFERYRSFFGPEIKKGKGIGREAYLEGQLHEDYRAVIGEEDEEDVLRGREAEIAATVNCPCGRGRRLDECHCPTATRMKNDIKCAVADKKQNKEIVGELSRKYTIVKP